MQIFDNANWFLAVTDVIDINGDLQPVPIAVFREHIVFAPELVIYFAGDDCTGNPYVIRNDYEANAFSVFNYYDYVPSPNEQSIYKLNTDSSAMIETRSKLELDRADSLYKCSAKIDTKDRFTYEYFGELPVTTPPYSVIRSNN
ncbi:MAG: hypothetical protein KJO19_09835 [Woeseia sp.]|nr:hypothetical protein [Woeseia sp.]